MGKVIQAKHKIDRRLNVNLWGRPKSPHNKRPTRPGQHGARNKKPTDFGTQLMAKQKLKGYYGNIGEKQFRKYYQEASRRRGDTSEILIGLLESRLDTIIYRMKYAATVFAARQLVSHGHVKVNGKRVNIVSYLVSEGDEISLSSKASNMAAVQAATELVERDVPEYVEADHAKHTGKYIRTPKLGDVPYPVTMEPNLVVEFYSR